MGRGLLVAGFYFGIFAKSAVFADGSLAWGDLRSALEVSRDNTASSIQTAVLEHEVYYAKEKLATINRFLEMMNFLGRPGSPEFEEYFEDLEAAFSTWACQMLFVGADSEILVQMNRLHSAQHGDLDSYQTWLSMLSSARELRESFQTQLADGPGKESVLWALHEFTTDLSQILFHNNSPECVRESERAPKTLSEAFRYEGGFRALVARWKQFNWLVEDVKLAPLIQEQIDEFNSLIIEEVPGILEPTSLEKSRRAFHSRAVERVKSLKSLNFSLSDFVGLEIAEIRADFVSEVFNADGSVHELTFRLAVERHHGATQIAINLESLQEIYENLSLFQSIQNFIRIGLFDAEGKRIAFIDLNFRRRLYKNFTGLGLVPHYFPLNSQHDSDRLSELIDLGHFDSDSNDVDEEMILFLEDLSELQIVYDEIKILGRDGTYRIPIVNEAAERRHRKYQQSLKPALNIGNENSLKYGPENETILRLKFRVSLK